MPPIRVLIVDDSAVIRKMLSDALATDPEIEVAGTAANGVAALNTIPVVRPDLVTLDIEMPEMDGLSTLGEIRKISPRLPVIMFSSLTERGAAATLEALSRGASDYVTKPTNVGTGDASRERVCTELIGKIKSLCARRVLQTAVEAKAAPPVSRARSRIDIVAMGASTGGPNALNEVLLQLPPTLPVPIVIVQHMPPVFTRLLAERLDHLTCLTVVEGRTGQALAPGHAYVAPGDYHMTLERKKEKEEVVLSLNQQAPENCCRPAVDVLFRSVAKTYGPNALAVVLTGMGSDGTAGAAAIRKVGGEVIVQDEASSVVWGMPGSVVAARLTDRMYPVSSIGKELARRVTASWHMHAARAAKAT